MLIWLFLKLPWFFISALIARLRLLLLITGMRRLLLLDAVMLKCSKNVPDQLFASLGRYS
jgi:hypothetical protein